jgi:hypothetical protein
VIDFPLARERREAVAPDSYHRSNLGRTLG